MKNLDEILSINDSFKFCRALQGEVFEVDRGLSTDNAQEQAPPMLRAALVVSAFNLTVGNRGILGWLMEDYDLSKDLPERLRALGAKRCIEYVDRALQVFPDSKVQDDVDARLDFCDAHEREFRRLDVLFDGAIDEAAEALRRYVRDNRREFEAQVEAFWRKFARS
jgi:hypothetical protein